MEPLYISESEYDAIHAVRASYVKTLWSATPAHLYAQRIAEQRDESDAFRIGRALHCRALRPDAYAAEFAVSPKFDRRTKAGKEAAAEWQAANAGVGTVLDEGESEMVERMADAIADHESAATLLRMATLREATFLADLHGQAAKCRVDALSPDGAVLLDVKTAASAAPRAFARSCADFGYHLQMEFYRQVLAEHGVTVRHVAIVAVEKAAPHCVAVYELDMADLDAMRDVVARCVQTYRNCIATGVWPGYAPGVQPIRIPEWAIRPEAEA